MQFNDTATTKEGIIPTIEFWTRLSDGSITGTLLKQITGRINRAFDKIMPDLLSYSDFIRWDDVNHTDRPIGKINITSGQHDYTITEDDNSLDILNFTNIRILKSATATEFETLTRMLVNDENALDAMSPNPSVTGIPSHFVEKGNTIFLWPTPNYTVSNGGKLFFERQQSYFVSTDTTKEPGIPVIFHELLALYAALDWILVYRSDDTNTIIAIRDRIKEIRTDLKDMISRRNPTTVRLGINQADSSK